MDRLYKLYKLHDHFIKENITVSTVESCTSGLLGTAMTTFSNASKWYVGGIITYSNQSKVSLLNICHKKLMKYTGISKEIVEDMVKNGQQLFNTNICIATSGHIDPKNYCLCYVAICDTNMKQVIKTIFLKNNTRIENKQQLVDFVINELYDFLEL